MTKIEMVALDSFTASNADPRSPVAGDKFTINADEAEQLEASGLAKRKAEAKAPGRAARKIDEVVRTISTRR
jgi:hypothetical protein